MAWCWSLWSCVVLFSVLFHLLGKGTQIKMARSISMNFFMDFSIWWGTMKKKDMGTILHIIQMILLKLLLLGNCSTSLTKMAMGISQSSLKILIRSGLLFPSFLQKYELLVPLGGASILNFSKSFWSNMKTWLYLLLIGYWQRQSCYLLLISFILQNGIMPNSRQITSYPRYILWLTADTLCSNCV